MIMQTLKRLTIIIPPVVNDLTINDETGEPIVKYVPGSLELHIKTYDHTADM